MTSEQSPLLLLEPSGMWKFIMVYNFTVSISLE
ncbi:hypothetical protein CDAR_382741, partial [Caerostris darwini]